MSKTIEQGMVYLTEVADDTIRPAMVVNVFGNHSVIVPLRAVTKEEVEDGITLEGDIYVQFTGNKAQGSVAQVGSIKTVPNKKIGRLLGEMYDVDYAMVINTLIGRR